MLVGPANPIAFHAQWPKSLNPELKSTLEKVLRVAWNLFSVIVFPIGLIRLASTWVHNRALCFIVPGNVKVDTPIKNYWDITKLFFRFLYNPENFKVDSSESGKEQLRKFSGRPLTLHAADGAKLDGAFYPGENRKKAIIYAFGNGQQWENCWDRLALLKEFQTSILMVNPRGVGKSEGTRSEEGYALDIYSAYDYLIKVEKIDPEDILLIGFSMGGGYGTCGAGLVQKEYPNKKLSTINLCSFSHLQSVIQRTLANFGILAFPLRIGAKLLGFDMNPKAAWDKLKGEKCLFYNPQDEVIAKPASLYQAVKTNPVGKTHVVKMLPQSDPLCGEHNREFTEEEVYTLAHQIFKMLKIDPPPLPATLQVKTIQQVA